MKQKLFCKAHPDVRLHFRVKGNRPKGTFTKVQRHLHSRLLDWFCPKCERQPKCAFASVVGGTEPGEIGRAHV